MSPRIVICLVLSTIVGLGSAGLAVASGWGLIVGFLLWSVGGAVCLLITSLLAAALEDLHEQRAAKPEQHRHARVSAHA